MRQARLTAIVEVMPQLIASATLRIDTPGTGFSDITSDAVNFIGQIGAGEGICAIPRPRSRFRKTPTPTCKKI